jgi:hypothetical protein
MAHPAVTSASRGRPAPTSRPESGEQMNMASAMGKVHRPALEADRPRASCR